MANPKPHIENSRRRHSRNIYLSTLANHIATDSRDNKRKTSDSAEEEGPPKQRARSSSPTDPSRYSSPSSPEQDSDPLPTPNPSPPVMPGVDDGSNAIGVKLTDGVITMTNGQQYTAPPPQGFPRPQITESVWRNTSDKNRAQWAAEEGPKGWVRVFRAKYTPDQYETVSKLRHVIPRLVECPSPIIISPPTAKEPLSERLPAPWHFLLANIPQNGLDILVGQGMWSTPDISFFVLPYHPHLPNYICSLENFCYPDSAESNKAIAELVKTKLRSIQAAEDYLVKYSSPPNPEAAKNAINSISVESLEILLSKTQRKMIWNVYCTPPPMPIQHYLQWCSYIRDISFESLHHGTGVPKVEDQLLCVGCKSYDHPTGLCPFPRIVGWFGPPAKSASDEDRTIQNFDERLQAHPRRPQNGNGGRGNRRGGRGNRGRGGRRY